MAIYAVKPLFQKTLSPLANLFIKLKIHPTIINFAALFVSLTVGVLLYFAKIEKMLLLFVPLLVFIRIAFNALDGMVARGLKVSSANGEIYNELIDRISDCCIFLGMAFYFIVSIDWNRLNQPVTISYHFILSVLFLIMVLINSYLGILSKSAGKERIYSGFQGKADRMFYLGLVCLIYYFFPHTIVWTVFLLFMNITILITIGQRLWKAVKS